MLKLSSVFPKEINEHTYDAYFEALKDWKIEYIEKAALYFIGTSTFFPLPKDFKAWLSDYGLSERVFVSMREPTPTQLTTAELLKIAESHKKEN